MGQEQKQQQTLAERLIHKVCFELHTNHPQLLLFKCIKLLSILLCFSLWASCHILSVTTSLLSVEFFSFQTLQFSAQGNDLVGFALLIFLWLVLVTIAMFGCSFMRFWALMGSARRIWPLKDWNLYNWAHKCQWHYWTKNCRARGELRLFKAKS